MQRLVLTRDGHGCRAGLVLASAAGTHYLLTCAHAFQRDEPFAPGAIGESRDAQGHRVFYSRLRLGSRQNQIDAALIEIPAAHRQRNPIGAPPFSVKTIPPANPPTPARQRGGAPGTTDPTPIVNPARQRGVTPQDATLQLNQHKLTLVQADTPVQLGNYGFTQLSLAEGPPCHRGESGSLITRNGQPAAILIGRIENQLVLCDLHRILAWFHQHKIKNLHPVAFATLSP